MHFNPDLNKQANEVIFSGKSSELSHLLLKFDNNGLTKWNHQKHLGFVLDSKLDSNIHIEQKIKKCNKIIGFMRKCAISLLVKILRATYKFFVRTQLDYGDILYGKPKNKNFKSKLEKVQYKACHRRNIRKILYNELGFAITL